MDDTGLQRGPPAPASRSRRGIGFAWLLGIALFVVAATFTWTFANLRDDLRAAQILQARGMVCNELLVFLDAFKNGGIDTQLEARQPTAASEMLRYAYAWSEDGSVRSIGTLQRQPKGARQLVCPRRVLDALSSDIKINAYIVSGTRDARAFATATQSLPIRIGDRSLMETQTLQISFDFGETMQSTDNRIWQALAISLLGLTLAAALAAWLHIRFTRGIAQVNAAFDAVRGGNWQARAAVGSDLADISLLADRANFALAQIERQMRTLQLWGPRIAHDLLDALALVRSRIDLLEGAPGERLTIERQIDRIIAMSRGLLELATSGARTVYPVDLSSMVQDAANEMSRTVKTASHDARLDIASGVMVMANEGAIATILSNFTGNALRHSISGSITISLIVQHAPRPSFRLTITNPVSLETPASSRRYGLGRETIDIVALSLGMAAGLRFRQGRAEAWLTGPMLDEPGPNLHIS